MERTKTCPICKKQFIPAPEHVYRQGHKTNGKYVCSWSCACKEQPPRKKNANRGDENAG